MKKKSIIFAFIAIAVVILSVLCIHIVCKDQDKTEKPSHTNNGESVTVGDGSQDDVILQESEETVDNISQTENKTPSMSEGVLSEGEIELPEDVFDNQSSDTGLKVESETGNSQESETNEDSSGEPLEDEKTDSKPLSTGTIKLPPMEID